MLKNEIATGIDEVVPECLKKGGKNLIQQVYKLIIDIWKQQNIAESWKMSALCPMYKNGLKKYRETSMLNTLYKTLSKF